MAESQDGAVKIGILTVLPALIARPASAQQSPMREDAAASPGSYQNAPASSYFRLITPEPRQRTFAAVATARLPRCSKYLYV